VKRRQARSVQFARLAGDELPERFFDIPIAEFLRIAGDGFCADGSRPRGSPRVHG
jgi:hypothetical protein